MRPFEKLLRPERVLPALLALALAAAIPQVVHAASDDVYFSVHRVQKFQYYAFANDYVQWSLHDTAGTTLASGNVRDTALVTGALGVSAAYTAQDGHFVADVASFVHEDAQFGVYHLLTNELTVKVYVKGPTGTPYWIVRSDSGSVHAWRLGGLPGSLQPLNGISTATFQDSLVATPTTGGDLATVEDTTRVLSGVTGTVLDVNGVTYSLARTITVTAPVWIRQNVCILGCMVEAAHFGAEASGRVELQVVPYVNPLDAPAAEPTPRAWVRLSPNPVRRGAEVSFRAPAGEPARVSVFDVRGRRVADLFDGLATGASQRLPWRAPAGAPGLYFVRVESAKHAATARLVVLE